MTAHQQVQAPRKWLYLKFQSQVIGILFPLILINHIKKGYLFIFMVLS